MNLETPLTIEANDVQICAYGYYDPEDGELLYLMINGRNVSVTNFEKALRLLCEDDADGWDEPLDSETYTTLLNDSVASHWQYIWDSRE